MPEWQGKSQSSKLGYQIFIHVSKAFGLTPAYMLLRFVALYYFLFSRQSSKYIYQYFRRQHNYGKLKASKSLYMNYYRFGQTLLDRIVLTSGMFNKFTCHFDGEENLLDIVKQGKGGIFLSAHVGNWEAAGFFLQRLNAPVHVVMYDGEHQQIKDYLRQVTGERKFNVIVISDDLSHVYAIGEALQKNELVCLHADRFIDQSKTNRCRFMNGEALFPTGPFALAAGFDVPVSLVYGFKESNTHYHFFGSAGIGRLQGEGKRDFSKRLQDIFVRDLETKVKMYPEQWFNYYKFWLS
ncbi:MAG TPA: lipid A biosynthesis acyltransferase [Ohtaekwangia sp.]|nr:lipid A biosynthesis acyltransferase [Ohtaekwangia sp.]